MVGCMFSPKTAIMGFGALSEELRLSFLLCRTADIEGTPIPSNWKELEEDSM